MERALIIGGAGFVGRCLINCIKEEAGWDVYAADRPGAACPDGRAPLYGLDITEEKSVSDLLQTVKPDYIFHLAAQSSVGLSWKNPGLTIDVNIKGAVHVLEAARSCPGKPRVLLIGSSEEYGAAENVPTGEDCRANPDNLYAVTKLCQNHIGRLYAGAYGLDIIMTRSFNHIGPGQSDAFAASDFCRQAAEIQLGMRPPVMYVGNLAARRDFTDVRDVARAYVLLMRRGQRGETYNVGSGVSVSLSAVLEKILALSGVKVEIKTDPEKFRPLDVPAVQADISKITTACGWVPGISLEKTLSDMLDYWRDVLLSR